MSQISKLIAVGSASAAAFLVASSARAAVTADMVTPPGASAVITVTVTITTSLGTQSDSDTKTIATTATASSAFLPDSPPFTSMQSNALQVNFANTTFNLQFFCLPFIGCAVTLNVTATNLQFTLVQPACAPVAPSGTVAISDALLHTTGSYSVTGSATASGVIDSTGTGSLSGHISNPSPSTVKIDQLAVADQTYIVPPDQLPAGVSAMTILIHPVLTNTTLSGPFVASANTYDADNDGIFDFCDTCTDVDGDGFGDPGFPMNTCAQDNCPGIANPNQSDRDGDGIGDACDCLADIAPNPGGGDGTVNVADLLAVINAWGVCPNPSACLPDIAPPGGDGVVNTSDLLTVINSWGACP